MPSYPKNVRRCSVCKAHDDKSNLLRVVKTSEGFAVDTSGRLDGRGVYVHKNADCVAKAEKKHTLNAAFHCQVPDEVYSALKSAMDGGENE